MTTREQEAKELLDTVNGMLCLFVEYWQTFKVSDATVAAWAIPLKEYTKPEMWEAFRFFQHEEGRQFAPSVSEFCGKMDYYRDRRVKEAMDSQLLLEGPRSMVFDPIEEYSYKTSRTTPKKQKDESDFEVRKAVRCSRERKKEIHEAMLKQGFKKEVFNLGGKTGYRYVLA